MKLKLVLRRAGSGDMFGRRSPRSRALERRRKCLESEIRIEKSVWVWAVLVDLRFLLSREPSVSEMQQTDITTSYLIKIVHRIAVITLEMLQAPLPS